MLWLAIMDIITELKNVKRLQESFCREIIFRYLRRNHFFIYFLPVIWLYISAYQIWRLTWLLIFSMLTWPNFHPCYSLKSTRTFEEVVKYSKRYQALNIYYQLTIWQSSFLAIIICYFLFLVLFSICSLYLFSFIRTFIISKVSLFSIFCLNLMVQRVKNKLCIL